MRRWRFLAVLVCATVGLLAGGPLQAAPAVAPMPTLAAAGRVVVTAAALRVRSGPGLHFAVVATVRQGDMLTVIDERGAWLNVVLPGGGRGWVGRAFTAPAAAPTPAATATAAPTLTATATIAPTFTATAPAAPTFSATSTAAAPTSTATAAQTAATATSTAAAPTFTATTAQTAATATTAAPAPSAAPSTATPLPSAGSLTATTPITWFKLKTPPSASWQITADARDPLRFTLNRPGQAGTPRRLVVLFTKPSSAYDTALSELVTILASRDVAAVWTVINTAGRAPRGLAVLDEALAMHADLIFSMGSDAAAFAAKHFVGAAIPVVSVSAKDPVLLGQLPSYTAGSGTNLAYTSLNMPIEVQMSYLRQLKPGLRNIAVIYAQSNESARETQVKPLKQIATVYNVRITDVVVDDDKQSRAELAVDMPAAVAALRATDPELTDSIFWITGSTSVFNEIDLIDGAAAGVPVLSAVPDVVQPGDASAVMSIGVSFESNAHLAALYGLDILGGAKPGDLKAGVVSPPDIAINFRKARAIGLKIPFSFFESASFVYDATGTLVRKAGQVVGGH